MLPEAPQPLGPDLAHRSDVTACPCRQCGRYRAIGIMLQNQSEAVRFILYLKWLRWVAQNRDRDRQGWPATHTSPISTGE